MSLRLVLGSGLHQHLEDCRLLTTHVRFAGRDSPMQAQNQSQEIPLQDYHEISLRRSDFFWFGDRELAKVDAFHKGV